ncbi:hypothetical protein MTO96_026311 [Rhipicephalus appendiculatus]
MVLVSIFAGALLVAASAGAFPSELGFSASFPRTGCDFAGVDLEGAVDELLAKLPEKVTSFEGEYHTLVPGIEIGYPVAIGLNKLRRYGPALPYCVNGTRFLKVDVMNNGDLAFTSPWRSCSGQEGHMKLLAHYSSWTVIFRVSPGGSGGDVVLTYDAPALPVHVQDIYLVVEGAGDTIRTASRVLSKLLPSSDQVVMAAAKLVILVLFVAAYAAAYVTSSECDFSGIDLEGAVEKILARLPGNVTLNAGNFQPVVQGLDMGEVIVTGMNEIKRYGALKPFCAGGQRFLEVDFINRDDVAVYFPWRTCSGNEGHVMMRAELSRFTVIFRVEVGGLAENAVLRYEGPTVPVNTHNVHVIIEGAGSVGRIFSAILSWVLPAFTHELWKGEFFSVFKTLLRKALEQM